MTPLSKIGWRQRDEDGQIVIWDLPAGPELAPHLAPAEQKGLEYVEEKWGGLCRELAGPLGIPDGWMQSHVWRESGGNERITSPDGGIGLGQITSPALKGGHSDEELKDPRLNLTIAAKYMASLGRKYDWDFPSVSAAYNAGSVRASSQNKWGMVMTTGHVSSEVAAYNTFLTMKADDLRAEAMRAVAKQFTLLQLLEEDDGGKEEV